ncbi:MAG: isocyanide synthase family protein [Rickettsiales bacterium]|jgi:pyoverdine/dityrosine biosynthesis protein Dit1|nr:isocyanide synthase family protein [Rickettsiales bacterium]
MISKNETIENVILTINTFRRKKEGSEKWTINGQKVVREKISNYYDNKEPLQFIIPDFPWKSSNKRDKVMGDIPDDGELLSLYYFDYLMASLSNIYPFDSVMYIFLDSYLFNDLIFIEDKTAKRYINEFKRVAKNFKHIKLLECKDLFPNAKTSKEIREEYVKKYCWSREETEKRLKEKEKTAFERYNRGIPFLQEELAYWLEKLSEKEVQNKFYNELMVEFVLRDIGLSNLLEEKTGKYIRCSRYAQDGNTTKLGIDFFAGGNGKNDAPWHRMLLRKLDGSFDWIRRKDGEKNPNYKLITTNDGESGYFVEVE